MSSELASTGDPSPNMKDILDLSIMNMTLVYQDDSDGQVLDGHFEQILLVTYSIICILGLITNIVLIAVILGKKLKFSMLVRVKCVRPAEQLR